MQYIRHIRRSIKKDKKILISSLLWFLLGIVTPATSFSIWHWISTLSVQFLSALVLIECLILIVLLFALFFLHDKIKVVDVYFKDNNIQWNQLEENADLDTNFKEATNNDKE